MAQGTRQTADGRQKPCEFVSACISARGGRQGVKVNPIQAINVCKTCSHVPWEGGISCILRQAAISIYLSLIC